MYRKIGQPVIIPGDMGRASWVLVGQPGSMAKTFGTTCHGAGRAMSRTAAVKDAAGRRIDRELEAKGIIARAQSHKGLAEEQSKAYKNVDDVVDVVDRGETGFGQVELDLKSEIRDAIRLGQFQSVDDGFAEISRRRTFSHPQPPRRCLSTIHKSKGLECDNALMLLCDSVSFSSTLYKRRLFYVGMSRAKKTLTLVLSKDNPSPLLRF